MPKVSQEYRDARKEQILAAAKRCFLRDGFHETSMQDLFAESGLSAGAVYRYFPGKQDVILAIAEQNMREVTELISARVTDGPDGALGGALADVLEVLRDKDAEGGLGAIAVLVWSEALRNPAVAKQFGVMFDHLRAAFADLVREHQKLGTRTRKADVEALTSLVMSIVPGFLVQLAMFGPDAVAGVPNAARRLWPA